MLRDAAAMDSNLLGEKMIATSRTSNGTRRVVGRRDGRIIKMGGRWMKEKGEGEAGEVAFYAGGLPSGMTGVDW